MFAVLFFVAIGTLIEPDALRDAAAGAITHGRYVPLVAAVAISIAISTVVVRLVAPAGTRSEAQPGRASG